MLARNDDTAADSPLAQHGHQRLGHAAGPLTCSNQEEATRQSERQRASGLVSWPNEQMFLFNRNSLWDQMARVDRLNGRPKERREQRVSVVGSHLSTAGRQLGRMAPAT